VNQGSGVPLEQFAIDAGTLSAAAFRERHGDGFLIVAAHELVGSSADTTEKTNLRNVREPRPAPASLLVFAVQKRASSAFAFVSLGRNEGNDIYIPHSSISRFHAYFRHTNGAWTILDARSSNGTTVSGNPVPRQNEGDAVPLAAGSVLCFGEVQATFLDDNGLRNIAAAALPT
jgi:hypothetical protein